MNSSLFSMGGYGPFIWSSYALAAVVLIANLLKPWLDGRNWRARRARQLRMQAAQQANTPGEPS